MRGGVAAMAVVTVDGRTRRLAGAVGRRGLEALIA
jgi:hypothetical protein